MDRPRIMDKRIEYLGKTLDTINWTPDLSDDECEQLRQEYYSKPSVYNVQREIANIHKGSNRIGNVTSYFVKDLMAKVHIYHSYWSLEEVWQHNDLIRHYYAKTFKNDTVYTENMSTISKIETAMRIVGKPASAKPTNFPLQGVRDILRKYSQNKHYYDFSCGWGPRMLGALASRIRYYGTDPNDELVKRLRAMASMYREVNNVSSKPDIRSQGSQIFVPEWKSKMGLAFSSPPYFFLEDYKIGDQSYRDGMTIDDWYAEYLEPTVKNIYYYLIDNGYFLLNIKNFLDYDLVGDVKRIAEASGFHYHYNETLKNITRRKMDNTPHETSDEPILVFSKHKEPPALKTRNVLDSLLA